MDVQMPDGTIISGVPDNISQSELLSRYQSYAESNPAQPPEKEGAIYGVAANITPSLATGIGSLMQFPGQIADLVTGTAPGDKAGIGRTLLGTVIPFGQKTVQEAGEKLQEIGREAKTVGLKEKERERAEKIAAAEGELNKFGTAFAETITDPSLTYSFLFEQLPNAIGGGIGGLLTKAGGRLLFKNATQATLNSMGVSGAVVTSAAQQGADIGYNTYKDIYEQLVKDGMKPEEANVIAAQKGRVAAAEAGALSYATSKIPGAREFEKALFKGSRSAIPQAGVQGIAKGAAKGIIGGGISETGEELGGVFASNIGKQEVFPETSLTGGMGEAAAMALIGGPIMEGTAGAINARSQAKAAQALQQQLRQQQEQAQTTEAAPVAPAAPEQIAVPESESQRTDVMMAELEGRPLPVEEEVVEAPAAQVAQPEDVQSELPGEPAPAPVSDSAAQVAQPLAEDVVPLGDNGEPIETPKAVETAEPVVEGGVAANTILQNRERSSPASIAQMNAIANQPDYSRVAYSASFLEGAPVVFGAQTLPADQVGRIGQVISAKRNRKIPVQYAVVDADQLIASNAVDGSSIPEYASPEFTGFKAVTNGRVAGLKEGYVRGTMSQYKQDLLADDIHGISPDVINRIKNPILVRIMPQDQVTQDIADESNTSSTLALSATERAKNDANRIDLEGLQFREDGAISTETVRGFIAAMPQSEQQELIDKQGRPTRQAYDRLNAAIFYKAYGNDALVSLAAEAKSVDAANIINGLSQAAPQMAQLAGTGEYDIRPQVVQSAEMAINASRQGQKLADVISQQELISEDSIAKQVLQLFANNTRSAKKIGEGLRSIATNIQAEASRSQEPDMFGEVPQRKPATQVVEESSLQIMLDAGFTEQDLNVVGFTKASPELQAEVAALQKTVSDMGLDPVAILETLENELANRSITRLEYYEKAKTRLEQAIREKAVQGGGRDVSQADVPEGAAREEGLVSPSEQEVLEQPTSVQISPEQQKADSLDKFVASLYKTVPPFRAVSANRTFFLKPQPLNRKQITLIKDLAGEAIDLGMPASIFENVSAAGTTRMGALAAISQEDGWLLLGGQWNSSTRAEKLQALVHELGHSVDNKSAKSGKKVSEESRWQKAHDELKNWYNLSETKATHPLNYPFNSQFIGKLNPKSESFAQAFSFYFVSPVDLQTNAPEAYSQIQSIVEGIQNESQRTGATSTTKAGAAGIEVQPSRTQKGAAVQSKAGEVSAGISRTERVEDRGAVETDAFKRWFGDSKVVNDDGNPKVLYRGQRRDAGGADFDLRTRATPSFTDDVNVANVYSVRPTGELGRDSMVIPGYMRMEKPLDLRDYGSEPSRLLDLLGDAGLWGRIDNTEIAKIVQDLSEQQFNTGFLSTNANDLDLDDVAQELSRAVAAKNEDRIAEILDETSVDPYALADSKVFVDAIKKQGRFDGIIVKDVLTDDLAEQAGTREYDTYRPFQTSQFKSTFNRGTFGDTENISFAQKPAQPNLPGIAGKPKGQTQIPKPLPGSTWTNLPDMTRKDEVIIALVDKNYNLSRVQKTIEDQVGKIQDEFNAYRKEALSHGRAESREKDFYVKEVLPIIKEMKAKNISDAEMTKYLVMRHAKEANDLIARRNPNNQARQDNGVGYTYKQREEYFKDLDPKRKKEFESIASKVDSVLKQTRDILENGGVISPEERKAWEDLFEFYVPTRREESDFLMPSSGYRRVGDFAKSRVGSSREVVDVLSNIVINRLIAINRVEKERIARAFYGMNLMNPNPEYFMAVSPDAVKNKDVLINELEDNFGMSQTEAEELVGYIMTEPTRKYYNKETGEVNTVTDVQAKYQDYVLPVKLNGKDRFVFANPKNPRAVQMVQSLRGLDVKQLTGLWAMSAPITRWFSAVNTQYNLIFGAWNFMRDIQGAQLKLTATDIADKKLEVLNGTFKAIPEIYKALRERNQGNDFSDKSDGSWADFIAHGGKVGYKDQFQNLKDSTNIVQKELDKLDRNNLTKATYATLDWISNVNDVMENSTRLSAYRAALNKYKAEHKGKITERDLENMKDRAADIAKNLTVNFNRKGTWGAKAGSLYAFFNASVQGTVNLAQTLRGPAGKLIMSGGIALGIAQALWLAMAGFDEDEPAEFIKQKNLIFPTGDGGYAMWPMPFGFNIFPNIGRLMVEGLIKTSKGKDTSDKLYDGITMLANSFNPLGGGGLWQMITPTALDPLAALAENRDSFGRPISRESRGTSPKPGYTLSRDPSPSISQYLSEFINDISFGSKDKRGWVSPTADQLDYLAGQITGGVGREAMRIGKYAANLAEGKETPESQVPIAGKIVGSINSPQAISQRFYNNVKTMSEHEDAIKGRMQRRENVSEYMRDNPAASLWRRANTLENEISKLNARRRELVKKEAPYERIKQLDDQKTRMMKQFNDTVRQRERQ